MIRHYFVLLIVIIGAWPHGARADDLGQNLHLQQLVSQLNADSFQARREAQCQLQSIGRPALPALRQAMLHDSAEIRWRAYATFRQLLGQDLVVYLPLHRRQIKDSESPRENPHGALAFPQTKHLAVADHTATDTDDTFTLAAWVKPTRYHYVRLPQFNEHSDEPLYPWGEAPNQWHGHFILTKWQSQNQHGDYIFAVTPSGRIGLGVANSQERFQWDALQSDSPVELNRWTHVAATFHAGSMKLYLDGKLDANKNSAIVHTNRHEYPRDDIHVGSLWNGGYNFHGQLRDICIFKRALSREEIQQLMFDTQ